MSATSASIEQLISYDFTLDFTIELLTKHLNEMSSQTFIGLLGAIQNHPIEFLELNKGCFLDECWCDDSGWFHSRKERMIRQQFEDRISNAVAHLDRGAPIHLLSIHSEGLFQDLMLLIHLYQSGFTNIYLDCIEKAGSLYPRIMQEIIIKWNHECKTNICFQSVSQISLLPQDRKYQAVYAVDLHDVFSYTGRDFSSPAAQPSIRSDGERLASLLTEALSRLHPDEHALFWLSWTNNIVSYNRVEDFSSVIRSNSFGAQLKDVESFDLYCINANIAGIIHYFPLLMSSKKPIFIDDSIADKSTLHSISSFLRQCGLTVHVLSRTELQYELKDSRSGRILVLDDSFYTPERWIHETSYLLDIPHFRTRLNHDKYSDLSVEPSMPIELLSCGCPIVALEKYIIMREQEANAKKGMEYNSFLSRHCTPERSSTNKINAAQKVIRLLRGETGVELTDTDKELIQHDRLGELVPEYIKEAFQTEQSGCVLS